MDNLARDAMVAQQAGMSYGKWKSLQPVAILKVKGSPKGLKLCAHCGTVFGGKNNQKYCTEECREKARYKKRRKVS